MKIASLLCLVFALVAVTFGDIIPELTAYNGVWRGQLQACANETTTVTQPATAGFYSVNGTSFFFLTRHDATNPADFEKAVAVVGAVSEFDNGLVIFDTQPTNVKAGEDFQSVEGCMRITAVNETHIRITINSANDCDGNPPTDSEEAVCDGEIQTFVFTMNRVSTGCANTTCSTLIRQNAGKVFLKHPINGCKPTSTKMCFDGEYQSDGASGIVGGYMHIKATVSPALGELRWVHYVVDSFEGDQIKVVTYLGSDMCIRVREISDTKLYLTIPAPTTATSDFDTSVCADVTTEPGCEYTHLNSCSDDSCLTCEAIPTGEPDAAASIAASTLLLALLVIVALL